MKGKDKKSPNAYGQARTKFTGGHAKATLDAAKAQGEDAQKEALGKILKSLDEGFDKTESMKAPSGETYGELLKAGKLPVGP